MAGFFDKAFPTSIIDQRIDSGSAIGRLLSAGCPRVQRDPKPLCAHRATLAITLQDEFR